MAEAFGIACHQLVSLDFRHPNTTPRIAVTLQPTEKTLTDPEIEAVSRKIVDKVAKATGGVLRA